MTDLCLILIRAKGSLFIFDVALLFRRSWCTFILMRWSFDAFLCQAGNLWVEADACNCQISQEIELEPKKNAIEADKTQNFHTEVSLFPTH